VFLKLNEALRNLFQIDVALQRKELFALQLRDAFSFDDGLGFEKLVDVFGMAWFFNGYVRFSIERSHEMIFEEYLGNVHVVVNY